MTELDLEHAFTFAKGIAYDAGRLMVNASTTRNIQKKGEVDLVTETDIAINHLLSTTLATVHKDIDVVAEEGVPKHLQRPGLRYAWIIDPIDGTTNFVHGLRHSAISIALFDRVRNTSLLAIVLNPFHNECFTAGLGRGAFLNNMRIHVSRTKALGDALICTGFAYDRKTNPDNNLAEFTAMLQAARDLRRLGAASLDLAYVAAGRFDGYFERGLQFWDMAAGALLVTEAGGMVSRYDGSLINETTHHVMATNGLLHPPLQKTIKTARNEAQLPTMPD